MSAQRYRKQRRYGNPVRPDASNDRLSDLTFEAGQRAQWAAYFRAKGKPALAAVQEKKAQQARKALETLSKP